MTLLNRLGPLKWTRLLVIPGIFVICPAIYPQNALSPSLSSDLGGSLSTSTSVSGLNTAFDSSTSNLTNEEMHSDVSDATHSQLLGSAFSPLQNSSVFSSVDTSPRTNILSDAQSAVGYGDSYFGGRRSQSFTTSGMGSNMAGVTARETASSAFGVSSMQSAFTGSTGSKTMFSGPTASTAAGTALGFSGEGISLPPTQSGVGSMQTLSSTSGLDVSTTYRTTDPVLSGDSSSYQSALQLQGDLPMPSAQVGQVFSNDYLPETHYQYEDGQTPPISAAVRTGFVLGAAPEYNPPSSGFPDSTRGLAGLPSEVSNFASPLVPLWNSATSPFAPVSEGTVYGLATRLNPNLHNMPATKVIGSFQAFEQRAQEQRIIHGESISESSSIYQQDLRNYRAQKTGQHRRLTLQEMGNKNQHGVEQEIIPSRPIR